MFPVPVSGSIDATVSYDAPASSATTANEDMSSTELQVRVVTTVTSNVNGNCFVLFFLVRPKNFSALISFRIVCAQDKCTCMYDVIIHTGF